MIDSILNYVYIYIYIIIGDVIHIWWIYELI